MTVDISNNRSLKQFSPFLKAWECTALQREDRLGRRSNCQLWRCLGNPFSRLRKTAAGKLPAPMDASDYMKPGTEARDWGLTSPKCEFSFKEENRERTQLHSLKDASMFYPRKTSLATFVIWKDLQCFLPSRPMRQNYQWRSNTIPHSLGSYDLIRWRLSGWYKDRKSQRLNLAKRKLIFLKIEIKLGITCLNYDTSRIFFSLTAYSQNHSDCCHFG